MQSALGISIHHHLWIPALGELFDARDIDAPIVQIILNIGHVLRQKSAICANRVSAQGHGARFWHMLLDECERLYRCVFEGRRRNRDRREQPGLGVHLDNEGVHLGKNFSGMKYHEIGSLGNNVQFVVGN